MSKKTILSGIQPSGHLHLGNYIGAIRQWVDLQNSLSSDKRSGNELIFCIVDLHAITIPQDPKILKEKILELAALYIACGIDPKKSKLFIQSENPDHPYLAWIFDCITPMGWMERMTQYKDKSRKQGERTSVGLFHYPTLMASDILLYDTDVVPVGEDQTQHIELTRDIAKRFNRQYGEVFRLPKALVEGQGRRIMSLSNPALKMSKSDKDPSGTVNLLDTKDQIIKKIARAVTDSGSSICFDPVNKQALSNLLCIYSSCSGKSISHLERQYKRKGYSEFKKDLAEIVVETLGLVQTRYTDLRANDATLMKILNEGLAYARERSHKKVILVRRAMGLGRS